MNPHAKQFLLAATLVSVSIAMLQPAKAGTIYNLANDWSDTNNPNGAWSYRISPTTVLTNHFSDWDNTRTLYQSAQPAWSNATWPNQGHIAFFLKAVAVSNNVGGTWDYPLGHVYMHNNDDFSSPSGFGDEPAGFFWTAQSSGVVQITGDMWEAQPTLGRSEDWALVVNGTTVSAGTLTNADASSAAPLDLATGTGGFAALTQIVNAGDVIALEYTRHAGESFGTQIGVDLQIDESPLADSVPEPSSLLVFAGLGIVTGIGSRYRRRAVTLRGDRPGPP